MFIPKDIFMKHLKTLHIYRDHSALRYTIEYTLHCMRENVPYGDLIDTEEIQLDSHLLNLMVSSLSDEERLEVSLVN